MYKLGTNQITAKTISILKDKIVAKNPKILDIGSGDGSFIKDAREVIQGQYFACDYTDSLLTEVDVRVDIVNLNQQNLPYADNFFDAIAITEVVEHIENPRELVREIFRVLKTDGIIVVSTPNILNLKSRLRFLIYGFWNLFGPLKLNGNGIESTNGHISPISFFYLAHAMCEAGFKNISVSIDKVQKNSLFWLIFLYPIIKLLAMYCNYSEENKFNTIDSSNKNLVNKINSLELLLGRTIIILANK
jgi:ubiquinone/menaquinone biosynthesis C-methylase UbiE